MDDGEWLSCADPQPMLDFLRGRASERKLRLFAVACCRRVWMALSRQQREAVRAAERYADGRATAVRLRNLSRPLVSADLAGTTYLPPESERGDHHVSCVQGTAAYCAGLRVRPGSWQFMEAAQRRERAPLAELLRDVFGNPLRPVDVGVWLTPTVLRMARVIYEGRCFEDLPILADALEDAGCVSPDVLEHCRGPELHTRGCWVLDRLLNKA